MKGPGAAERFARLLAIVPWLAIRAGATYDEIAERFGGTPDQVRRDLELLSMCGQPPYGGGDLIDVYLDDDWVSVDPKEEVARPLRLNQTEGFRVLAAGQAVLQVEGPDRHEALASALDKLRTVLGDRVEIDVDGDAHLPEVQEAARTGTTLEVEYYSLHRDEVNTRRIDPHWVHNTGGRWYVEAHDHLSGEMRRFRVSRIQRLSATDERFDPPGGAPPPDVFAPGPDADRVRLRLPAEARWVVESYPVEEVTTRDDHSTEVTLVVAGRPWLERLLLRVGPAAEVLEPEEWRTVGAEAAERVLARYSA